MKRRTLLTSTLAAGALSSVGGPLLAQSAKKSATILGANMAYVEEGTGRPVVFLHGNPTSSYLWRNIIPHVSDTHRAIAPDLIGMGDSGKPDIAYTYADHEAHLFALLDSFDLEDAVLVIHDWGSALGFHYARTRPGRVSAVAFMEAITAPVMPFPSYDVMGDFEEMFRTFRTEGVGEQVVLDQNMFIDQILGQMMVSTPLSEEVLAEYNRYYPTPESRAPILQWPREIPIGGVPDYTTAVVEANNAWLTTSEIPKLLLHVTPGAITPPPAVDWLRANVANLETVDLGVGLHFIQEDHPDAIGSALADWLTRV